MTIFQIKQLTSVDYNITCDRQKQVFGGGAEDHWQGYSDGELNIGKTVNNDKGNAVAIAFTDADNGDVKGSIAIIDGKTYTFF